MTKKYCIQCGEQFYARADAQTCSSRCRQKNRRNRLKERDDGVGLVFSIILTLIVLAIISVIVTAKGHNAHSSIAPAAPSVNSIDKLSLQINSLNERVTTLEGKTGAKGEQGPRGERGPAGEQGPPGSGASLSSNVTLQGNSFNGVNGLVQLDGAGNLPALNALALTNINASNILSGTINDLRLSSNVTLQGNSFNGVNQLIKLDSSGGLPSLSAVNLTNLNPSNISVGSGAVSIKAGGSGSLTLDTSGSGTIWIGASAQAKGVNLGNTTGTTSVGISAGTGGITIGANNVSNTIGIGNFGQVTQTINIGTNNSSSSTTTINIGAQGGGVTSNLNLNSVMTSITGGLALNSGMNPALFTITGSTGQVLSEDTNNSFNLIASPSFEPPNSFSGWSPLVGSTLVTYSPGYSGNTAMQLANPTLGAKSNASMNSFTSYTFSIFVKADAGFSSLELGRSDNGSATTACLTNQTVTTSWTRLSCSFTTGSVSGLPFVYFRSAGQNYYVDAVQLETGSIATPFRMGSLSLNSLINSPFTLQPQTSTTTAFQILNTSNFTLFGIDTVNSRIFSNIPDSPGSIGFTLSTAPYTTSGAKLLSVQNNGSEKFSIDKDGNTTLSSGASLSLGGNGGTTGALTKWFTCTAATSSGDVVVIDTANPGNMTTTNVANSPLVAGVVKTGSSAGGTCEVAISGVVQANVTKAAAVAIGDRLTTSTTAGQGNTNNAPAVSTVYAKSLSSKGAGVAGPIWVILTPQ